MLIVYWFAVLGEGDLIYTKTLCGIGLESYRDKTVLVLGGGDGGILHELLKEEPKFITVAEIGIFLLLYWFSLGHRYVAIIHLIGFSHRWVAVISPVLV